MLAETVACRFSAAGCIGGFFAPGHAVRRPELSFLRLAPGGGKVRTDLTGFSGDDRNTGGFQYRPGVEADTASDEPADAVPGERFGRPDPGTAC